MWFAILGLALVLMKLFDIGPPGHWDVEPMGDLWKFLLPFVFAAVWWTWADASGRNRRIEMKKLDDRADKRRQRNRQALGLDNDRHRPKT